MNQREQQLFLSILFYAALGLAAWFAAKYLLVWFFPFWAGGGLSALLRPTVLRVSRRFSAGEKTSAFIVTTLFYVLVAGSLLLLLVMMAFQAYDMLLQAPQWYAQSLAPALEQGAAYLTRALEGFSDSGRIHLNAAELMDAFEEQLLGGATFLLGKIGALAARLPHYVAALLFTLVISFLTGLGYTSITLFLRQVLPEKTMDLLQRIRRFLREVLWQYLRAYTLILAATFLELSVGLCLLGVPYALPLSALIAVLDILPVVGCGTVLVPWSVFSFLSGDTPLGFGLLLLYGVIFLVRMVLEPRVVGAQIGLHPVVTMTAMYAGLQIGGVGGMLIAPLLILAILKLGSVSRTEAPPDPLP